MIFVKADNGAQPSIKVEPAQPSDVVGQQCGSTHRGERDVKELRRRFKSQRNCDEEQRQSSSDRGDTVEARLDQLARSTATAAAITHIVIVVRVHMKRLPTV